MSAEVVLRAATIADLDVALALVRDYHRCEGIHLDEADRTDAIRSLVDDDSLGRIWLLEADGRIVGYVAICFGYSIEFGGRDAFVDELFVEKASRGKGIGAAALAGATDAARALGVKALHLEVERTNERARRLYRGLGFASRERFHLMSRPV